MTNEQIIMNTRLELMDKGILQPTGRQIELIDEKGNKKYIDEPEQIHTYVIWKELGYQVKRGEKAIVDIKIWKYTTRKVKEELKLHENDDTEECMFLTKAFFFKFSQVEKIE